MTSGVTVGHGGGGGDVLSLEMVKQNIFSKTSLICLLVYLFVTMASLVLLAAPPGIPGPDSLIGRNVAAFFDPPGAFFPGKVISFERPHEDDSIEAAAEGIWYRVKFDDGHLQDYNITELSNILIPPGNEYGQLGRYEWTKAKLSFDSVGTAL